MDDPPVEAGVVQETVAEVLEVVAAAATPVGAPGTVAAVIGVDVGEAGDVPLALVAVTVKV